MKTEMGVDKKNLIALTATAAISVGLGVWMTNVEGPAASSVPSITKTTEPQKPIGLETLAPQYGDIIGGIIVIPFIFPSSSETTNR